MGEFNVDNVLTVLAVLLAWNIPLAQAVRGLSQSERRAAHGDVRRTRRDTCSRSSIYAHTPDALAKALRAARLHCRGQLRLVFDAAAIAMPASAR